MAESTKQITFEQTSDQCTGRTSYTIKRLFNMQSAGFHIGAVYPANEFKNRFTNAKELQGVDIILE